MSREHLKCFLPLPTSHIVGKMHMSSKCTQHVITSFQVPSPPVYASRTENQDAINMCVINSVPDPFKAHAGIKILEFKPFNPVNEHTECIYHKESSGKLKHVTKGMTGIIVELCTHNKIKDVENRLEADVEEFATHGLCALAVAFKEPDGDDHEAEGNGFELISLLSIFDPPCDNTKRLSAMPSLLVSGSRWLLVTSSPVQRKPVVVLV